MKINLFIFVILLIICFNPITFPQIQNKFNPFELFDPTFLNQPGTIYRSGSGQPGPEYWQNRADYKNFATLDTKSNSITGSETITYINNSPDELSFLWVQLDQNLFTKESRGALTTPFEGGRFGNQNFNGGNIITSVNLLMNGRSFSPKYTITDTRMQIFLSNNLEANGKEVKINISWSFKIPDYGSDRMGIQETKKGPIYEIAQ